MKVNMKRKVSEEKIALLENSVFKTKNSTSLFDDIENKIIEFEGNIKKEILKMSGEFSMSVAQMENKIFQTNNRISLNEVLKK